MTTEHHIVLDGAPPKLSGYARSVLLPRAGVERGGGVPRVRLVRRGLRIDERHVAEFRRLGRWEPSDRLPFVYPLMLLFHYHLGIFAHPDFPCSLRHLLGLRNHVVQRRPIAAGERLDLEVRSHGQRMLPKGVEFDIYSVLSSGGAPVWESVHVYYLRGPRGGTDARPALAELAPLEGAEFETRWEAPAAGGWRFARLSGDFNPAHYFRPWARTLGFERDFSHSQRVVSECLRRLPETPEAGAGGLCLDVMFKGPVYYDRTLVLKAARRDGGYRFDLYCGAEDKPAVPGRIRPVDARFDLVAEASSAPP